MKVHTHIILDYIWTLRREKLGHLGNARKSYIGPLWSPAETPSRIRALIPPDSGSADRHSTHLTPFVIYTRPKKTASLQVMAPPTGSSPGLVCAGVWRALPSPSQLQPPQRIS